MGGALMLKRVMLRTSAQSAVTEPSMVQPRQVVITLPLIAALVAHNHVMIAVNN